MVYLIAYRLNKPGQDYSDLYEAIRKISGTYWHHTTSSWLVQSTLTAKQVYEKLGSFIDKNDDLVVYRLQGEWYGYLPNPKDTDWLKERLF